MADIISGDKEYPCVPIELEVDRFHRDYHAYVDTGAEYGIHIPKDFIDEGYIKQKSVQEEVRTIDEKTVFVRIFLGVVKLGERKFKTSIAVFGHGREVLLGREVLDNFKSCFDGPNKRLEIFL